MRPRRDDIRFDGRPIDGHVPDVPAPAPVARLAGIHKAHGAVRALDGIDLDLRPGEVLALLGANGAGKSTAVSVLLGLAAPDAGTATLGGLPPLHRAARAQAGAMLQSAALPATLRVGELLDLARSYHAAPRSVADCVALGGLDGLVARRYGALSGGQQRRVQFALALCGAPRLLVLDEPTTGLDHDARQRVWSAIRTLSAEGAAVLLTTHYLEEAEALADRVVVLDRGRVVAEGSVDAIRSRVAQSRIRARSVLDAAEVAGWPGVRAARNEAGVLELRVDAAEPVLRQLLARDPQLHDLEVRRADLAEAFLHITRDTTAPEAA